MFHRRVYNALARFVTMAIGTLTMAERKRANALLTRVLWALTSFSVIAFTTSCQVQTAITADDGTTAPTGPVLSGEKSLVSLAASEVQSGAEIILTIAPKDTNGDAYADKKIKVEYLWSDGTSSGTFSNPVRGKNWIWTSRLLGVKSGTPARVQVIVN